MNRKIKAMLVMKGLTIRAIAARAGVSEPAISGVIGGHWPSKRVKQVLANELEIPLSQLEKMWESKKAA